MFLPQMLPLNDNVKRSLKLYVSEKRDDFFILLFVAQPVSSNTNCYSSLKLISYNTFLYIHTVCCILLM